MSTIDMTQVAGIQAVNAEGKVIGTLTVDDLTELVATKIVQEAKNEAVSARSASMMSDASTLAATDEYEDKLDIDTNPAYIRSMDSEGNPKRTATTSLATVVGGLLPVATLSNNGIMTSSHVKNIDNGFVVNSGTGQKGKYVKLFTLGNYHGVLASVKYSSYGDANRFHIVLHLGTGDGSVAVRYGLLQLGSLNGFKFYMNGFSVYMYVPSGIKDCYIYLSSQLGTVHNGKDILDSIDTSVEISIS